MAQKLAPVEKNSTDISAASAAFCISERAIFLLCSIPHIYIPIAIYEELVFSQCIIAASSYLTSQLRIFQGCVKNLPGEK